MRVAEVATRLLGAVLFAAAAVLVAGSYSTDAALLSPLAKLFGEVSPQRTAAYVLSAGLAGCGLLLVLNVYVVQALAGASACGLAVGVMSYEHALQVQNKLWFI